MLEDLAETIYSLRKKEYVYKRTPKGELATRFSRLRDPEEGAAVATFRQLERDKAHMPTNLWE